jgi:hypothetical protein
MWVVEVMVVEEVVEVVEVAEVLQGVEVEEVVEKAWAATMPTA